MAIVLVVRATSAYTEHKLGEPLIPRPGRRSRAVSGGTRLAGPVTIKAENPFHPSQVRRPRRQNKVRKTLDTNFHAATARIRKQDCTGHEEDTMFPMDLKVSGVFMTHEEIDTYTGLGEPEDSEMGVAFSRDKIPNRFDAENWK